MLFTEAAMCSDPAQPGRNNQDGAVASCFSGSSGRGAMLAVADGVGGLEAGDSASKAALSVVSRYLQDGPRVDLEQLFRDANNAVLAVSARFPRGAATTLAVVSIDGQGARVASAGDTIVVLARHGVLVSQSTPDVAGSAANERITRYLGSPDSYAPTRVDWPLEAGDTLITCSDGIWRFVGLDELCELTVDARSLAEYVSTAVERARDSGSDDDATIAVVRIWY